MAREALAAAHSFAHPTGRLRTAGSAMERASFFAPLLAGAVRPAGSWPARPRPGRPCACAGQGRHVACARRRALPAASARPGMQLRPASAGGVAKAASVCRSHRVLCRRGAGRSHRWEMGLRFRCAALQPPQ